MNFEQTGPTASNPLLVDDGPPDFSRLGPEHVEPAVTTALENLEAKLVSLENGVTPTWEGLVHPYEDITAELEFIWRNVGHLTAVKNSPALREVYDRVQKELVLFSLRFSQSQVLYDAFRELRSRATDLDPVQRRIVDKLILAADLSGVGLAGEARERFNVIESELADLSRRFANQTVDATKAFSITLTEEAEVQGLPENLKTRMAESARRAAAENESAIGADATAEAGPWRLTLEPGTHGPFLQHSPRRDLRERLYRAFMTRASSGEHDNTPLVTRILTLRHEKAELLGYEDYAALSLASKVAPDVATVEKTLDALRQSAWPAAEREVAALRAAARAAGAPEGDDFQRWDSAFWSERLREARFDYSDEALRPYFPLGPVLDGIFRLFERLFGVRVVAADGEAPVWDPAVRYFRVQDRDGSPIASFYLDPFSRPGEKRNGAWHGLCRGRRRRSDGKLVQSISFVVCNLTPPVEGREACFTMREVLTLLHEFGHALQSMLSTVEHGLAAGLRNIEWDAIEIASQFMENWLYHGPTLGEISSHVETGEPIPDDLQAKIRGARTFMAGSQLLGQLHYGCLDLELHHRWRPDGPETPFDVEARLARTQTLLPRIPEARFLSSLGHIFAGGYAAGLYSYKWAEIMSADAFAAFEEAGLDSPGRISEIGEKYRETFLSLGGGTPPSEVFRRFRGRDPRPDALLRHAGLAPAEGAA